MPSTAIRDRHYDPDNRILTIEFITGRRYVYADVPPEIYEAFCRAISKGGFFNRRIRDRYPFAELTEA